MYTLVLATQNFITTMNITLIKTADTTNGTICIRIVNRNPNTNEGTVTRTRRYGICRQTGHTKWKCLDLTEEERKRQRKNQIQKYLRRFLQQHV